MRILVVEDELDLQEALAEGLRIEGYAVDTCSNGKDAYELAYVENYDLIILDLNLPKMDGLKVLEKLREENKELKVLILSARISVNDKVKGLDIGANDYLTKPFAFAELEARIRNLLRRKFVQENSLLSCGNINIDLSKRTAFVDEKELILTKKEFALLEYFLLNQERVVSQEELIEHIWDGNADSFSGAIRVHIATLRKKMKALLDYDPIRTKIGEGYFITKNDGDA
ncbi:response regulator transcription factor [Bacillus thuringiensis]|uniref:Response regulator transcription factor n=1 Tax=Bacillus thuringiensis serovar andalousiensis TaxID=257985 RepID=A0A6H0TJJ8_BACTU|nr:response regulator transcription factor [Bacillus thuringiensis]QIW21102.1 response regulator transcription factor [Bacillus thuringiensis serovar andalousiensis]